MATPTTVAVADLRGGDLVVLPNATSGVVISPAVFYAEGFFKTGNGRPSIAHYVMQVAVGAYRKERDVTVPAFAHGKPTKLKVLNRP